MNKFEHCKSKASVGLAYATYLINRDLKLAKKYTDQIQEEHKAFKFYNKAFFAILNDDPKELINNYFRIRYDITVNAIEVIEFLQNERKLDENNILFNFAIGYINKYHGDRKFANAELRSFIAKANNITKYSELLDVAKKIIPNV